MSCSKVSEFDVVAIVAGSEREFALSVDHDAIVVDLVTALVPGHGRPGAPSTPSLSIDGIWFDHCCRISDTGLRNGSTVVVDSNARPEPTACGDRPAGSTAPMVVVVGGPDGGRCAWLSTEITIGSGRGADLRIDDATVSPVHLRVEPVGPRSVRCVDLDSHNGLRVAGRPVRGSAIVAWGTVVAIGATEIAVRPPADELTWDRLTRGGPVRPFNRPPRDRPPGPVQQVPVPDAPGDRRRIISFDAAAIVGPIVVGALMVVVFGSIRYAAFALMGPLLLVISQIAQRRRATLDSRMSARSFRAEIGAFRHRLDEACIAERERLEAIVPDPATIQERAIAGSTRLWERRPGHGDDLMLRLGRGERPWHPPVDQTRVDANEGLVAAVMAGSTVAHCPIELDLGVHPVVGIVGDRPMALALARSLVIQAAVLHGPADLGLEVHADDGRGRDWLWAGWLPHARLGGGRAPRVFEGLQRETEWTGRSAEATVGHRRLMVVDGPALVSGQGSSVRRSLSVPGTLAIVLADHRDRLPSVCRSIVSVDDLGDASVMWPEANRSVSPLVIAGLSAATAVLAARALAGHEDPESDDVQSSLPGRVTLIDILGPHIADPESVLARWEAGSGDLATPIGTGAAGVFRVDLVADGPHMLVGGTTGSGKSELLRSLIAGLAAGHDPDQVVFVLIDYKGGSAFDACARLPHVVGLVTDLDDQLARRALRSFEAELRLREERLRVAGAGDLCAYRSIGSPRGPMPRLVVVVDEFATMVAEVPDFVGSLVGIAQRGRSLGVHLVLATQRPSGAVSAEIRANTNLRVALRVQDPGDSMDVIDRRDAAAIDRRNPGRALIRVGPSDVTAVQTALATSPSATTARSRVVARPRLALAGRQDHRELSSSTESTDLSLIVERCLEAHRRSGRALPRRPWLDQLPDRVELSSLWLDHGEVEVPSPDAVRLALADDPDRQCRQVSSWLPGDGHLGFFGAVGAGTSSAVVAAAVSAMFSASPEDLWVYGFDHGGGTLGSVADLPHVGAIVGAGDVERRSRLIGRLADELARRRNGATAERHPRILVLVDQLPALLAEVDHDAELSTVLRRVLVDGAAFGIAAVVSAERPPAMSSALLGSVIRRFLLRPSDPVDAAAFGVRPRDLPAFVPGRGVDVGTGLVVQVALAGADAVEQVLRRWEGSPASCPAVDVMPHGVALRSLPDAVLRADRVHLPVGPGDPDLAVRTVELGAGDHLFVAGPAGGGVSTSLRTLIRQLRRADPDGILVIIADQRSPVRAESVMADAVGTIEQLGEVLARGEGDRSRRWTLVVDGADQIQEATVLERLARSGHCRLVVGARSDRLHGAFGHWTRCVRLGGVGLLLHPRLDLDGELLGVRLPRAVATPLRPGRGFLVDRGTVTLVQAVVPDEV